MEATSESVITARELTRTFGKYAAVNQMSLTIDRGEIFGLVGPDGAGKTTTLRLLAGILRPTNGAASVAGYDVRKNPEAIKNHIGYMAQQFSLYGDLTVMENLRFFADIYQVSAADRQARIPRLLQFSRMERFANRRAGQLSGGMQKKLGLACTLIHQPEVIYLDEPTTGVDPVSRREFWDILTELHMDGISIVVSTPYMDEAERCSRIGLMFNGKLIACDTPVAIQGMVQGEMLEIQPAELNGSAKLVASVPGVQEVQTYGDLLHVFVDSAKRRIDAVRAALENSGHPVLWMRTSAPRMEEAFIHLIRKQQGVG
ncbi:MAG: ABC transporter ATP-binding protein [Anaerolineae bacterium]|nr:ABC transporter ATP-binding protein [Anaerolineae bacterium]